VEIPAGGSAGPSRLNDRRKMPSHNSGREVETLLVRHRSAHNSRPPGAAGETRQVGRRFDKLTDWICGRGAAPVNALISIAIAAGKLKMRRKSERLVWVTQCMAANGGR